jgi:hypothetical protein
MAAKENRSNQPLATSGTSVAGTTAVSPKRRCRKSLAQDVRKRAKTVAKPGQGEKG